MGIDTGDYVSDLTRMLVELDDETLTTKNLTACVFASCIKHGLAPGQFLVDFSDKLPGYDDWFENYLPEIMELPDDYESIESDGE